MGYNPWINAAKAAHAEIVSDEAIAFLKATAMEHTLLTMFYFMETVFFTVEAGRITRRFVDSFSTPPEAPVVIAGYLMPARENPPITTQAVISNQQKLEQEICTTIKGIYENVQSNQVSLESHQIRNQSGAEVSTELAPSPSSRGRATSRRDDSSASDAAPTRSRKPRKAAASGDKQQAKDKAPKSRVPRKSGAVQEK